MRITIELNTKDKAEVIDLHGYATSLLASFGAPDTETAPAAVETKGKGKGKGEAKATVAKTKPAPAAVESEEESQSNEESEDEEITEDALRTALVDYATERNDKQAAYAILEKYKAKKVADLDKKYYAKVMAELTM